MQGNKSLMCRYFCIRFIVFMLEVKRKVKIKKSIILSVKKLEHSKILKDHILLYKTIVISIICGKCGSKLKRTFKE